MNAVVNFAFEENLVRVIEQDGEPWFVANDICKCLSLANPRKAVGDLDDDEKGVTISDTLGGRQEVNIVSEPGVYRLVFRSRKPEAERFKRWLAHEVIPAIRRTGTYIAERQTPTPVTEVAPMDVTARKVAMVTEARMTKGPAFAAALWDQIGLPSPDTTQEKDPEALACLRHLLDAEYACEAIRLRINRLFSSRLAEQSLRHRWRIERVGAGFILPIDNEMIASVYAGTRWQRPFELWRKLPGAQDRNPKGGHNARDFTWLPSEYLDI
ncbi:BRO-N domain-containing protein [Rhizobium sp. PAMB 3182]